MPPSWENKENDAEHSFSLAVLSWYMLPHFPELDLGKIIQLCLAHDIFEVYSGDTFSFDEKAIVDQGEREKAAIERLQKEWADFPALHQAITEYEQGETREAKFVQALDMLQSALMDYLTDGLAWHKLGLTQDRYLAMKDGKMAISPEVDQYYQQLRELLVQNPSLFPDAA